MFLKNDRYSPWFMWLFPLLFFAFQFILRLWPGLMSQPIMVQLHIDVSQFGIIAAFYYYGYAGMQIPMALSLDRFGTRAVLCVSALVCGMATILFTYATHWYVACFARFLVGAGSAAGFLAISKVVSEWFPRKQYTKIIGFSFTVGLMGAIFGGKPINFMLESYPWQQVAVSLSVVALLIGLGAYAVLRQKSPQLTVAVNNPFTLKDFKTVLASPMIWLLAFANLLMVGALEGFSDVWGVPYLMSAYPINKGDAAQLISYMFFGMLIGGPLLAWFSKKLGHYTVIALCGLGMALMFFSLLALHNYHAAWLSALFFVIGVLCCYQVIVFAAGAELVNAAYLGMATAFLNCINMLGGSFFHTIIGHIINLFWQGVYAQDGAKWYTLAAYQKALLVIPICALAGAVIVCFLGLYRKRHASRFISEGYKPKKCCARQISV